MARIRLTDLEQVLRLPVAERIRLVEAIWDSIVETPEAVDLTEAQKAELDRRIEAFEKNPEEGSPWAEVRAHIWQRE
jgi:putative addiction module component (TIGR02574 family)